MNEMIGSESGSTALPAMIPEAPAVPEEATRAQDDGDDIAEMEVCNPCSGAPDLWLYRDRTTAMLKRYARLSVEVGRLPSLLGREFFRTRVTSYRVGTFEDAVIFVHDVEQALEKLDWLDQRLIARIVLQDYTQDEVARLMGCARRTVVRRFPEVLDRVSEIFLAGGLLNRLAGTKQPTPEKACQEGESGENSLSDCEQGE